MTSGVYERTERHTKYRLKGPAARERARARALASIAGETYYESPEACPLCETHKRYTVSGRCIKCDVEYRSTEDAKDAKLRRQYGIGLVEYNKMLDKQNGVCAICGGVDEDIGRRLCVDHCHDTGEIRGLLCALCNTGLGSFKDDRELIYEALMYLAPAFNDDKYDIGPYLDE